MSAPLRLTDAELDAIADRVARRLGAGKPVKRTRRSLPSPTPESIEKARRSLRKRGVRV